MTSKGRARGARQPTVDPGFRQIYRGARARVAVLSPLLVAFEDKLVLLRGGKRHESAFTPPLFHTLKMVAHVPIAVFVSRGRGTAKHRAILKRGMDPILESLAPLGEEAVANVRAILTLTKEHLEAPSSSIATFARHVGPLLRRCTEDATRLQLRALDRHATALLSPLSPEERDALEVVVAGVHQARQRSLPVQYFARLLGEPPDAELRLSYAEGARSVEDAILLVGTRRLDREIAAAFFGDPWRLQRDILGDAARQILAEVPVPPFERAKGSEERVARLLQNPSPREGTNNKGARHGYDAKRRKQR